MKGFAWRLVNFETEAQVNSEMAYYLDILSVQTNKGFHVSSMRAELKGE